MTRVQVKCPVCRESFILKTWQRPSSMGFILTLDYFDLDVKTHIADCRNQYIREMIREYAR